MHRALGHAIAILLVAGLVFVTSLGFLIFYVPQWLKDKLLGIEVDHGF